ncbi:GNAT family N-acetyltransferase [Streptomyces sp. P1-3]|uniref:GNAT family N-acetyltransferase n=1 Tax=Streptomyces sp. P1-3 TaxID=3421658 RepID=UPI003D36B003
MVTVQPPRLALRRWREEDVAPLAAINADPEVMRWVGDGSTRDEEQTRAGIEAMEREWEEEGFGLFAVEIRATGRLAGFSGLSVPRFLPEVLPAVEAGWRLGQALWGRGLASEAGSEVLCFGFRDRGLEKIVSIAQVGNAASERIMDKLGMRVERELVDPTCGRLTRVHAITRLEYDTA